MSITKKNVYTIEDYKINDEITYKVLSYDSSKNVLYGYIFINNYDELVNLINSFNNKKKYKPNSFVDFYNIIVCDKSLISESISIVKFFNNHNTIISNICLYYYEDKDDSLKDVILSENSNNDEWFLNYVKPIEIQNLLSIHSKNNLKLKNNINLDDAENFNFLVSNSDYLNQSQQKIPNLNDEHTTNFDNMNYDSLSLDSNLYINNIFDSNKIHNMLLKLSSYYRELDNITNELSSDNNFEITKNIFNE